MTNTGTQCQKHSTAHSHREKEGKHLGGMVTKRGGDLGQRRRLTWRACRVHGGTTHQQSCGLRQHVAKHCLALPSAAHRSRQARQPWRLSGSQPPTAPQPHSTRLTAGWGYQVMEGTGWGEVEWLHRGHTRAPAECSRMFGNCTCQVCLLHCCAVVQGELDKGSTHSLYLPYTCLQAVTKNEI